jgi:hypothetical protein
VQKKRKEKSERSQPNNQSLIKRRASQQKKDLIKIRAEIDEIV